MIETTSCTAALGTVGLVVKDIYVIDHVKLEEVDDATTRSGDNNTVCIHKLVGDLEEELACVCE
jgi:hypothetical protein